MNLTKQKHWVKMLEIFRELRGLLHVSHVHIDSWVFRLHYSVTTTCMFAFSLIVSAKQYVGNPIDCIHTKDIPEVILKFFLLNLLILLFKVVSFLSGANNLANRWTDMVLLFSEAFHRWSREGFNFLNGGNVLPPKRNHS